MKYETLGDVADGRLKLRHRQAFETAFAGWPDGPVLATFQTALVFRSAGQNRFWHSMVVGPLARHCGCTPRQMHDALRVKLLPELVTLPLPNGTVLDAITIGGATSQLTQHEAANVIERGLHLLDRLGVAAPTPLNGGANHGE